MTENTASDAVEAVGAAEAEAKALHDATVERISASHDGLLAKFDEARTLLRSSLEKARGDIDHCGYAESFVVRGHLLVDEFAAWIKRHV